MLGRIRGRTRGLVMATALLVGGAIGGASCSLMSDDDGGDFTLLSYNVAGLPQEISQENPEEHLPLISPLLNDYDIVLLQEDFDWWQPLLDSLDFANYHDRLHAAADHEYATGAYPGPEAVGMDPAARPSLQVGDGLAIRSRYLLTGETRVPWSGCFGGLDTADGGAGDCLAAKGFARVTMTLKDDADEPLLVDVYTLHAEAGATAEDQRLQEADFVELAAYINQSSQGRAVIVGGDTNLHTHSDHADAHGGADTTAWDTFLSQTGLTDACAAVSCPETDAIDKVAFRSGGGVALTAESHAFPEATFRDAAGDDLSDHLPLVVEFSWKADDEA